MRFASEVMRLYIVQRPRAGVLPAPPVLGLSVDHIRVRMRQGERNTALEPFRQPDIVAIEKGHPLAASCADPEIARRTGTAVDVPWMLQIADARAVALSVALGDIRAAVARPVVDQQQLPIVKGLGVDAGHRFSKESLLVEEDNDDRGETVPFIDVVGRRELGWRLSTCHGLDHIVQ